MAIGGISGTGSSSSNAISRQTIADNFDTFLQLLTTQLKNQNPLDPMDTNAFTQQLVQFTSVEQQLKTNDFLEAMVTSSKTAGASEAASFIGKQVTASGSTTQLVDGKAAWSFSIDKKATVSVSVRDTNGNVVYTKQGSLDAGVGQFNWDGIGDDGKKKPDGSYQITIDARDTDGKLVPVATDMAGTVTGVDFTGSEPVLLMGTARVNLSAVLSVRAPSS